MKANPDTTTETCTGFFMHCYTTERFESFLELVNGQIAAKPAPGLVQRRW